MRRVIRYSQVLTVFLALLASVVVTRSATAQDPSPPAAQDSAATVTTPAPATHTVQPAGPRLQTEWRSVPAPTFTETTPPVAASATTIRMSTLALVLVVVILVLLITD